MRLTKDKIANNGLIALDNSVHERRHGPRIERFDITPISNQPSGQPVIAHQDAEVQQVALLVNLERNVHLQRQLVQSPKDSFLHFFPCQQPIRCLGHRHGIIVHSTTTRARRRSHVRDLAQNICRTAILARCPGVQVLECTMCHPQLQLQYQQLGLTVVRVSKLAKIRIARPVSVVNRDRHGAGQGALGCLAQNQVCCLDHNILGRETAKVGDHSFTKI